MKVYGWLRKRFIVRIAYQNHNVIKRCNFKNVWGLDNKGKFL